MTDCAKGRYASQLETKPPFEWARLIRERIQGEQLQAWISSICCWKHPNQSTIWKSPLAEIADNYRSDFNTHGAQDLKQAFEAIGIVYHPSKADNSISSDTKKDRRIGQPPTERARQILEMSERGMRPTDIAERLSISWQYVGKVIRENRELEREAV